MVAHGLLLDTAAEHLKGKGTEGLQVFKTLWGVDWGGLGGGLGVDFGWTLGGLWVSSLLVF